MFFKKTEEEKRLEKELRLKIDELTKFEENNLSENEVKVLRNQIESLFEQLDKAFKNRKFL